MSRKTKGGMRATLTRWSLNRNFQVINEQSLGLLTAGKRIHMALQPELQQCQVPELAALDTREMPIRSCQQQVDVSALIQTPLAAGR